MIATIFACLMVYAAGSFAAPAAGWEGVRFAYSGTAPPVARTLMIAAVESLVGFGTAAMGVALATVTPEADDATLIAAAAVGLGFGIARSLRSARAATVAQDAAAQAGDPEKASGVGIALRRVIGYAVLVRALSAAAVPLAAAAFA